MNTAFSRISENVLFSLLVAVVAGWMVVSAADVNAPVSNASATVAQAGAPSAHS